MQQDKDTQAKLKAEVTKEKEAIDKEKGGSFMDKLKVSQYTLP